MKIVEYPRLFEVFGFEYGGSEEDGEFQLPDPRDYFLRIFNPDGDRQVGDIQKGGIPDIQGSFYTGGSWISLYSIGYGTFASATTSTTGVPLNGSYNYPNLTNGMSFSAARSNSQYKSNITEVRPNNMSVRLIIKATYEESSIAGIIDKVYPVGSLFLSLNDSDICPIEIVGVGKWELVESDRVLQTSSSNHNSGELVEAGLPDIMGQFGVGKNVITIESNTTGCFVPQGKGYDVATASSSSVANYAPQVRMFASYANSIYGNSGTVQPPALVVKVWKRVS